MINNKNTLRVSALLEQSELGISRVYNERWLTNKISTAGAQKPGLALAGYFKYLDKGRIQVFGKTETGFLMQLPKDQLEKRLKEFMATRVPCIVISENQEVHDSIIASAEKNKIPLLISDIKTSLLIPRLTVFLYRYFTEKIRIHGVMMDILGLGILITGASGIGKSETALELVSKGSHLVSDDRVEFYLNTNEEVVGRSIDQIKKWIEVRGLGVINIVEMFGVGAMQEEKKLDLVINLEKWNPKKKYERLGEGNLYFKVLGKDIPMFQLPVAVGRNLSTIIEVAVKYFISRKNGGVLFTDQLKGIKKND